jgi:hypothetical protein
VHAAGKLSCCQGADCVSKNKLLALLHSAVAETEEFLLLQKRRRC